VRQFRASLTPEQILQQNIQKSKHQQQYRQRKSTSITPEQIVQYNIQHAVHQQQYRQRHRQTIPASYKAAGNFTDNLDPHNLGWMNVVCLHCRALHFAAERTKTGAQKDSFNDCCRHGKVRLTPIPEPPQFFKELLSGTL
jgi:hypothetical protein